MSINLSIGPEAPLEPELPQVSEHILNLRGVDDKKRKEAREEVSVDLKEEIRSNNRRPGRICIMAEMPAHHRGLSRIPMVAAALLIILILNLGQLVFLGRQKSENTLALAGEAFVSLQNAGEFALSGEEGADLMMFEEAEQLFADAKEKGAFLLQSESAWLALPNDVQSLQNLLDSGTLMAEVGQHLARARSALTSFPETGSITEYLKSISEQELEPATAKIHQIVTLASSVDLSGTPYAASFESFKEKLNSLVDFFDLFSAAKDPLLTALGDRYPQHYLVLLQNNDEMRIGGGFIGSLAIVEINEGRITNFKFHDVYDWDGSYFTHQEVPVHELRALTEEWRLRDSNISADFPVSAQKAMWFLEEEGGPGVDGVIAMNLSSAQTFLEDTGSLSIPSLQKAFSAETFPVVLTTLVEAKINQTAPKAILGELVTAFMSSLKTKEIKTKIAFSVLEETRKKQILLYHKDPSVQALINFWGMSGDLPAFAEMENDFFMPIFTNIGSNKTDRYMETSFQHDTYIFEDGSMVDSVTLTRTHTFTRDSMNWLKSTLSEYGFTAWNPELEQVLGNDINHSGIRLYVPEGSQILETEGIMRDEIQFYYDPLEDVSYYYVDQIVAPGTSETFTVRFSLPWNFHGDFEEFDFDLFKQPGMKSVNFEKTVAAPGDMLLSGFPLATDVRENIDYVLSGPFQNDLHLTLLFR